MYFNFIENITYDVRTVPLLNYVFDRLNNHQTKWGQRVDIFSPEKDLKKRFYNIEHFLPQSKKSKNEYTDEQKDLFDKIWNLLIVPSHTNPSLGDKEPIDKIRHFMGDFKHLGWLRLLQDFITEYGDSCEHWHFASIKERSVKIAEFSFSNVWNF